MISRALVLAALVVLSVAPVSSAEDEDSDGNAYTRIGPYLFVGGVLGVPHEKGSLRSSDVSTSGGVMFGFGFRMVPLIAFEAQGEWIDFDGLNQGSGATNVKLYGLEWLDLELGRFQPYLIGTAGFGYNEADGDNPGGHFRIGLGLDIYLTEDIAAFGHAQYTGQGGNASDLRYTNVTIGALWRF